MAVSRPVVFQGAKTMRTFTCAAAVPIYKNSVLTLSDPNTAASGSLTDGIGIFAGIAAMDKDSTDDSTTISGWIDGDWVVKASGVIAVGAPIAYAGNGRFISVGLGTATSIASGAIIAGYSKETAADGETFIAALRGN